MEVIIKNLQAIGHRLKEITKVQNFYAIRIRTRTESIAEAAMTNETVQLGLTKLREPQQLHLYFPQIISLLELALKLFEQKL